MNAYLALGIWAIVVLIFVIGPIIFFVIFPTIRDIRNNKRYKNKINVKSELIAENYDPETLEDVVDKSELNDNIIDKGSAGELVKQSYKDIKSCKAHIQRNRIIFIPVVLFLFSIGGGGLAIFDTIIYNHSNSDVSQHNIIVSIVIVLFLIGIFCAVAFYLLIPPKIYDVYLFKIKGRNEIFYINKRITVYYRNRKETICVRNKTQTQKKFSYDVFMNSKLCYNPMIGEMKIKETDKLYKISTTQFDSDDNFEICLDKDTLYPKKSISQYCHIFESVNDENMYVEVPKVLLEICKQRGITPPPYDERIRYI